MGYAIEKLKLRELEAGVEKMGLQKAKHWSKQKPAGMKWGAGGGAEMVEANSK